MDSPSQKDDGPDDSAPPKFITLVYEKIVEAAPGLGGADKSDLQSRGILLPLIILYALMWFGSLTWFAVSGALAVTSRVFINLDGNSTDTVCQFVPSVTTGVFQADAWGNWETSPDFGYNNTIFVLEFQGSKIDYEQYKDMMGRYEKKIKALGQKAKQRNTAWSLMAWSTFTFVDPSTNSKFYSTVKPDVLFDANIWGVSIASNRGFCSNNQITSSFSNRLNANFANGKIQISYRLEEDTKTQTIYDYGADGPQTPQGICSDQGSIISTWGWNQQANPDFTFTQGFDIKTTAIIIALNTGLTQLSNMIETHSQIDDVNPLPKGKFYLDPSSVPMDPIYCLDSSLLQAKGDTDPAVCFYPVGTQPMLVYPLFLQIGPCDGPTCRPCKCPADGATTECNQVQSTLAYVYPINGDSTNSSLGNIKLGLDLQKQIALTGDTAVETLTFNALNDVANLAINNLWGQVNNPYCIGGPKASGTGTCTGYCPDDGITSCVADSDCQGKPIMVDPGDGTPPAPDQSGALMPDTASCMNYCIDSNQNYIADSIGKCKSDSECTGASVGTGCAAYYNQASWKAAVAANPSCVACSDTHNPGYDVNTCCTCVACSDTSNLGYNVNTCCDDTKCCNYNIYSYSAQTAEFEKTIATSFKSLCSDDTCAVISVLIDYQTSIFEPMNDYNVMMSFLSGTTYDEKIMEYNPKTDSVEPTGKTRKMPQLMCVDSFYNASSIARLSSKPPTDLVQAYYRCHATLLSALSAAIGSAAGSANLYANTAIAIVCFIIFKIYNTAKKDKQIISEEKKAKLVQELAGRKEALLEELVSLLSMDYVDRKRQERNSESKVGESEDAIMEDLAELEKINAQKSTLENRLKEGKESRRARLLTETLRESITGGGGGGDDGTPKRSKGRAVTGGSRRTAGRSPISRRGRPDDMDLERYGFNSASESDSDSDGYYSTSGSEGEEPFAASRGPAKWIDKTVTLKCEGVHVVAKVMRFNPTTRKYSVTVLAPPEKEGKRLLAPEAAMKLMSISEPMPEEETPKTELVSSILCVGMGWAPLANTPNPPPARLSTGHV